MTEENTVPESQPPIITADEFAACDFEAPLAGVNSIDSSTLWQAFQQAATQAEKAGLSPETRIFQFLVAVCSIHWTPEDRGRPWGPMWERGNQRSMIPSDLAGAQTEALARIVPGIRNVALRVRLADIVCTNDRKKGDIAAVAISAYCESAEGLLSGTFRDQLSGDDSPPFGAIKATQRALQIAYATTKRGRALPERPRRIAHDLYERSKTRNEFVAFNKVAGLGLYYEFMDQVTVAGDAEALAGRADGQYPIAVRGVWEMAARLYDRVGNQEAKRRCQLGAVEQLLLMRKHVGTAGAEAHWVMEALQALRHIKGVEEKEEELEHDLRRLQRQSTKEMVAIPIEFDVGEDRERTINLFSGYSLGEALKNFATFSKSPAVADLRKQALENIKHSPLMAMMGAEHVDDEGKPITRTSGARTDENPSEDWYVREIDRAESLRRVHVVAAGIDPARLTLCTRFSIGERHFEPIVAYSPFVPDSQKGILILGFARFFQGDCISAAYLVLPQLEPCLRHVLKLTGHIPVKRFDDSTEEELDLGGMFDRLRPQLESILTTNIAAELERLFHVRPGPALRHEIAHGLLSSAGCYSPHVIYAVWLIYRICCLSAWQNWDDYIGPALNELE